jgi:hypothetical protein
MTNPGVTDDPSSEPPTGRRETVHRLGQLEFDRAQFVYYVSCRCGRRFGPASAVANLHADFDEHRRAAVDAVDDESGAGPR